MGRIGNGHTADKKRLLSEEEKTFLYNAFVGSDGRVPDDFCVTWRNQLNLSSPALAPVTSFQVAGYVVHLHALVRSKKILIKDTRSYTALLAEHRSRYPKRYPAIAALRSKHIDAVKNPKSFWDFYTGHEADFKYILDIICSQYARHMDANDLRAEVLIRFERNQMDLKWDPNKSQFQTYLANTARGYAQHVLDLASYRPTWESKEVTEATRRTRVPLEFDKEDGSRGGFQIRDEHDFEASYEVQDTLRVLRSRLPKEMVNLFDRQARGMTLTEIATETGKHPGYVSAKVRSMRTQSACILNEMEQDHYVQTSL